MVYFVLLILCFLLKTIYNYLVFKYEDEPFYRYKIKWLKNEYKKNKGKLLKYLTNVQLDYDIYDYYIDDIKCKEIGKLGNQTTYIHIPDINRCNCGYKISEKKYRFLINKLNKNLEY